MWGTSYTEAPPVMTGQCSCPPTPLATRKGSNLDAHFGHLAEVRMLLSFQRPPRLPALAASRGGGERID